MPKKRRGTSLSGEAIAGTLASSNGRAIITAVPWMKVRRESVRWVEMLTVFIASFAPEQVAVDDTEYERLHAIAVGLCPIEDCFDDRPVGKPYRRAGGIGNKLLHQISRDLPFVL